MGGLGVDAERPLHSTEIVLGEAWNHLGGNPAPVQALLDWVRQGGVVLPPLWPTHLERTQEMMLRYDWMDAADASIVVLSERHPRAEIVTVDARDFRIYRRLRHEPLPLIVPTK